MATNGRGVSWFPKGSDRWLVRWRQPGDENVSDRSFRGSEAALMVRVAAVEQAKAEGRSYEWATEVAKNAPAANLLAGIEAFIAGKRNKGKISEKTAKTYGSYKLRVMDHVHAITKIPTTQPVPVDVLSRDLFDAIAERDRKSGASSMMSYAPLLLLMKAWQWMAGAPGTWNHVPSAPVSAEAVEEYLPRTPKYKRTKAPSMGHLDAVIRSFTVKTPQATKIAAIVMRYTGCRAAEVFGLMYEDLDLTEKTVRVRGTKTESADREIPLAENLLAEPGVRDWLTLDTSGPIFPKRRHSKRIDNGQGRKVASETFKAAWEAATEAGEVPVHVWRPEGRTYSRPEHGFRAAFMAHMQAQATVKADTLDYLVGHAGDLKATHYGRDLVEACREAVKTIPAIDWMSPKDKAALPENVRQMKAASAS